jgi:hypothetical protein
MISRAELKFNSRHVIRDCSPYICIYENYDDQFHQYSTMADWVEHLSQHAALYCCRTPGHELKQYSSKEELEYHLIQDHNEQVSESELNSLLDCSRIPYQTPFITFGKLNDDSDPKDNENGWKCLFCDCGIDFLNVHDNDHSASVVNHALKNHIAIHLESFALLSLPAYKTTGTENYDDSEVLSARITEQVTPRIFQDFDDFEIPVNRLGVSSKLGYSRQEKDDLAAYYDNGGNRQVMDLYEADLEQWFATTDAILQEKVKQFASKADECLLGFQIADRKHEIGAFDS